MFMEGSPNTITMDEERIQKSIQSTEIHWNHLKKAQRSMSNTRQTSQSTTEALKSWRIQNRLLQKSSLTNCENAGSIALSVMCVRANTFDRLCDGRARHELTIQPGRIITFQSTSLLANEKAWRSAITAGWPHVNSRKKMLTWRTLGNNSNVEDEISKNFQCLAREKSIPWKCLREIDDLEVFVSWSPCSTVYANWQSSYCTIRYVWTGMTLTYGCLVSRSVGNELSSPL